MLASAAVSWLVFGTRLFDTPQTRYVRSVNDFLKDKAQLSGRDASVEGFLVHGRFVPEQPCGSRFDVEGKYDAVLHVHYAKCGTPEIFGCSDGIDVRVMAQGQLDDRGVFEAQELIMRQTSISYRCPPAAAPSGSALPR